MSKAYDSIFVLPPRTFVQPATTLIRNQEQRSDSKPFLVLFFLLLPHLHLQMTYKKYKPNKDFPSTLTDLFPALGRLENGEWAVTVENCIYYLSLLEQFSQLLFKFKDHLDTFHARAEKRYELWTKAVGRRNAVGKLMVPPVDVAYLLHTHLLLPQRYVEDSERLENDMMDYVLPLKELVNEKKKDLMYQ